MNRCTKIGLHLAPIAFFLSFAFFACAPEETVQQANQKAAYQKLESERAQAEQGNVQQQYSLAVEYLTGTYVSETGVSEDTAQAAEWFRRAAEQGDPKSEVYLGFLYINGRGVPKDEATGIQWFRRAAEQGDSSGETMLATLYGNGQGIGKDLKTAAIWYRRAAEQGNSQAQRSLGQGYESGVGVPKDYVNAHMWYSLAATNQLALTASTKWKNAGKFGILAVALIQPSGVMSNPSIFETPSISAEARDRVAAEMSPAQLEQSRQLAAGWASEHRDMFGSPSFASPELSSETSGSTGGSDASTSSSSTSQQLGSSSGADSGGSANSAQGGSCPATLAYLAPQLPRYNDPGLTSIRTQILQSNLSNVMRQAISMGYTPQSAASAALQQAKSEEQSLHSAESCMVGFASDPAQAERSLQNGTFDFSIQNSATIDCAKAYVASYYAWVSSRETALGLACLAATQNR
jgi:uncharacterized protein